MPTRARVQRSASVYGVLAFVCLSSTCFALALFFRFAWVCLLTSRTTTAASPTPFFGVREDRPTTSWWR